MLDFNLMLIVTAIWGACWCFVYPLIHRAGKVAALSVGAVWGLSGAAPLVVLGAETTGGKVFFAIGVGLPILLFSVGIVYLAHVVEEGIPPDRQSWTLAHTAVATVGGVVMVGLLATIYILF